MSPTLYDRSLETVKEIIRLIGDDPTRPGLADTPKRVMQSWGELFAGYRFDPGTVFKVFDEPADEMIVVKNIEFYSTCEHHLLPFYGRAHVGYLPSGNKVIGASKLPRLVDGFSRRLQIQERIGREVVEALTTFLDPKGAACVIEAQHLCMCARGVGKQQSVMVTSCTTGAFRDDAKTRAEFLQFIKG